MGVLLKVFGEPTIAMVATVCISRGVTCIGAGLLRWHTVDGHRAVDSMVDINSGTLFLLVGTILMVAPLLHISLH